MATFQPLQKCTCCSDVRSFGENWTNRDLSSSAELSSLKFEAFSSRDVTLSFNSKVSEFREKTEGSPVLCCQRQDEEKKTKFQLTAMTISSVEAFRTLALVASNAFPSVHAVGEAFN